MDSPSQFEQDLMPLIAAIETICVVELFPFIVSEQDKYKDQYLKNPNSLTDLNNCIKKSYKRVLELLSKQYKHKLMTLYFSEEGLDLYIVHNLHKLSLEKSK